MHGFGLLIDPTSAVLTRAHGSGENVKPPGARSRAPQHWRFHFQLGWPPSPLRPLPPPSKQLGGNEALLRQSVYRGWCDALAGCGCRRQQWRRQQRQRAPRYGTDGGAVAWEGSLEQARLR